MNERRVRNTLHRTDTKAFPEVSFSEIGKRHTLEDRLHHNRLKRTKKAARKGDGDKSQIGNESLPKPAIDEGGDKAIQTTFLRPSFTIASNECFEIDS